MRALTRSHSLRSPPKVYRTFGRSLIIIQHTTHAFAAFALPRYTGSGHSSDESDIREQVNRILMQALGEIFNLDSPSNSLYVGSVTTLFSRLYHGRRFVTVVAALEEGPMLCMWAMPGCSNVQ